MASTIMTQNLVNRIRKEVKLMSADSSRSRSRVENFKALWEQAMAAYMAGRAFPRILEELKLMSAETASRISMLDRILVLSKRLKAAQQ